MAKSTRDKMVRYMVTHKGVTFQSMARAIGFRHADELYDIVNGVKVKKSADQKVRKWLKEHKKDPPKIRYP